MELATNPLSEVEELLIEANSALVGDSCPDCDRQVAAVDHAGGGVLYVAHTDDRIGKTSEDGTAGCRVGPSNVDLGTESSENIPSDVYSTT